jgi:hypothetical protein
MILVPKIVQEHEDYRMNHKLGRQSSNGSKTTFSSTSVLCHSLEHSIIVRVYLHNFREILLTCRETAQHKR